MLVGVVERGTGTQAAVEEYTTAGQTGTAQHVVRGGARHRKRLASFIGYVPAEAPQLGILVMIDEPRRAKGGGLDHGVGHPTWPGGSEGRNFGQVAWMITQPVPVAIVCSSYRNFHFL